MSSIEALIERQIKRWEIEQKARREAIEVGKPHEVKPIVTISRQKGSPGVFLAEKLAERLGYQLLHKEIIDKICLSSGYRRKVIESLDQKVRSQLDLWAEGMFKGMYIDASDYFRHLYKVMMSIAELGGVVVVGRGANFMLKRDQGFHIRVISSVPKRIQNLVDRDGMTYKEADEAVRKVDRERYDFVRSHFDQDIDDPRVYDMVLNMTYLDVDTALELVDRGIKAKTKIVSEIG